MKILRLGVEGFGPFAAAQEVDFEAVDGSLLLISGPTGAGKSSLLDAICFALYGVVPRYSGQYDRVRSKHADPRRPTLVTLEFEARGGRYRIERSPRWRKPSAKSDTIATAKLWHWDGQWQGVAEKPQAVSDCLKTILPLKAEQFLQVMMLAQNEFQKFLQASSAERQATLRTLFHTGLYARVETLLDEHRRTVQSRAEHSSAGVDLLTSQLRDALAADAELLAVDGSEPAAATGSDDAARADARDASPDAAEETAPTVTPESASATELADLAARTAERLAERLAAASEAQRAQRAAVAEANDALAAGRRLREQQRRLAEARTREAALTQRAGEIAAARTERDRAQAADRVLPLIERCERSSELHRRKTEAGRAALTELAQLWDENPEIAGLLAGHTRGSQALAAEQPGVFASEQADALASEQADDPSSEQRQVLAAEHPRTLAEAPVSETTVRWFDSVHTAVQAERDALAGAWRAERQRDAAAAQLASLAAQETEITEGATQSEKEAAELPKTVKTLREKRERALEIAGQREQRTREVETWQRVHTAVVELDALRPEHTAHERDYHAATVAVTEANRALEQLLKQRLDSAAGTLAAQLTAGEPCPVCGSTHHPQPATLSATVTDADIAAAEDAVRQAEHNRHLAEERHRASLSRLTALETVADGAERETAEQQLRAARDARAAADAAAQDAADLAAQIESAEHRGEALAAEQAALRNELDEVREKRIAAEAERREAETRIAKARGAWPDLAAKSASLEAVIAPAATAEHELREALSMEPGLREDRLELRDRLDVCGFDSPENARNHARDRDQQQQIERSIREFERQQAEVNAVLADPELAELPADPPDLDTLQQRADSAQETLQTTTATVTTLASTHQQRTAQLKTYRERLRASAAERDALDRLKELTETVKGTGPNTRKINLESYVLAARLESVLEAANQRLAEVSQNRYRLVLDDSLQARGRQSGLGISVFDAQSGSERAVESLSGGETFLASLSLAFGLVDVVSAEAGGIDLDTLFIDEGFGSLDSAALDLALGMLDTLRRSGRTIAVISHVAEMHARIPTHLDVVPTPHGASNLKGAGVTVSNGKSQTDGVTA